MCGCLEGSQPYASDILFSGWLVRPVCVCMVDGPGKVRSGKVEVEVEVG